MAIWFFIFYFFIFNLYVFNTIYKNATLFSFFYLFLVFCERNDENNKIVFSLFS